MINIYCDESCHLEHDNSNVMLMGAISCPETEKERIYREIRNIKTQYNISTWREIKWTSVSVAEVDFYKELINYFIREDCLSFRSVVLKNKSKLNHEKYNNNCHDNWYYKMYYYLLNPMVDNIQGEYKIFIDIKDTNSQAKVDKLQEVLCNNKYDFMHEVIKSIIQIKSHESEIMELTDLIMGAIQYYHNNYNNKINANSGKVEILNYLLSFYGNAINLGTHRGVQKKFDIFLWELR